MNNEKKNNKVLLIILGILVIVTIALGVLVIINKTDKKENNNKTTTTTTKSIINNEEFSYVPVTYKVCDDNNCNYVVGSMHLGDDRIHKFDERFLKLYDEMDSLAVELDITTPMLDVNQYLLGNGQTLKDVLGTDLDNKLKSLSEKHPKFMYSLYGSFKPGVVYSDLSQVIYQEIGYTKDGVDMYFLKNAHDTNKEIIELETWELQLNLLLNESNELYVKLLNEVVDTFDESYDYAKELYEAYLTGDPDKINKLSNEEDEEENDPEIIAYNEKMVNERNKGMVSKIEDFLKNDKDVFVVVGAAHVVGENGIANTLRNKGYKVEQVKF